MRDAIIARMTDPQMKGKAGRPTKPDDQKLVQRSIRLLPSQWAKFDASGGLDWLRRLIDKSKTPKPPPDKP